MRARIWAVLFTRLFPYLEQCDAYKVLIKYVLKNERKSGFEDTMKEDIWQVEHKGITW